MIINDSGSFSGYFCSFSIVCCGLIPLLGKIFMKSWSFTFVISLHGSMKWRHVPWTFSVTIFLVQMYFKLTICPSIHSNTSTLIHLPRQTSAIPMPSWPSSTPEGPEGAAHSHLENQSSGPLPQGPPKDPHRALREGACIYRRPNTAHAQ